MDAVPASTFLGLSIEREGIARVWEKRIFRLKREDFLFLVLVTVGAMFVHGYHPWAEDAALYLPPVERLLNQNLFPFNAEFFDSHAHLSLFPDLIAASLRVTRLPLP